MHLINNISFDTTVLQGENYYNPLLLMMELRYIRLSDFCKVTYTKYMTRLDFYPPQSDIRVHTKWGHNQIKYQECSFDFSTLCKDRTGRFFKANSTLQWSSYSSSYLQGPFIHAHSITLSECIAHLDVWTVEITSQDYHVIYDQPPFFFLFL